MRGKIFVNYRRDDARDMAARIRDRLAGTFGNVNVFMDIDHLIAGQVFDKVLEKALAETDVLLAVIGSRWLELLAERQESGERDGDERDYVREEIAAALRGGIVVIPVLIEATLLPKASTLPEDIRNLVRHQKHAVTHEQFGRDVAGLVEAIRFARKAARVGAGGQTGRWIGLAVLAALLLGAGVWWIVPTGPSEGERQSAAVLKAEAERKQTEEVERQRLAAQKVEQDRKRAEEAERQRLAALKAEEERKRTEEERRRAAETERQRLALLKAEAMRPGREFRDCADVCPLMVMVPAGDFMMGSPPGEAGRSNDEGPQRKVRFDWPFAVGKFEVTFAEWDGCVTGGGCAHRPSDQGWGKGRRPVIDVSWHDAKEYVAWLSRKTGKAYRLLSEAEWEYAARAGTTTRYAFGDTISRSQAQFSEGLWGSAKQTVEVGTFAANVWGLHDMHGNVWEWVEDNWHPEYLGGPLDGSVWQEGDVSLRLLRGGSWNFAPGGLRSAGRNWNLPTFRSSYVGFRVSRTL
jgi:formylglycine-generating enzyme required for sulfatase activity